MTTRLFHYFRHLRVAVATLAMLAAMWAAVDLHTHQTGLHAPVVCTVCALENAVSGGCAPAQAWAPDAVPVMAVAILAQARPNVVARRDSTLIRAPPTA